MNLGEIFYNCDIVKKSNKSKRSYSSKFGTFDIETSRRTDKETAFMYLAQFCIDGECFMFRTWREVREFIAELSAIADSMETTIVLYVHNLSYEFEFIRTALDGWLYDDDIFNVEPHKPLYARYKDNIEFRCSYLLTNMSLRSFLRKMKVETQKTELDYDKIRYPWTPLTKEEITYGKNDVLGLWQGIKKQMEQYQDDISTIPLTSTGYVRRNVRAVLQKNRKELNAAKPNYECYLMLRRAFRGGDTHANRYIAMEILENVASFDITSSYPYELASKKYPMGKWEKVKNPDMGYEDIVNSPYGYIMEVRYEGLRLKDPYNPMPYVSYSKTYETKGEWLDNGRILKCDTCVMCVTDIDYQIISEDYDYDTCVINKAYRSEYKPLPSNYVEFLLKQYTDKTYYKGAVDDFEAELYMKSKNMLNSLFGDVVQDPIQEMNMYNVLTGEWYMDDLPPKELYAEYRKKFTGLPYQVGVWVTAYARYSDRVLIRAAGDKAAYTDTDCVKIINPDEAVLSLIKKLNKERKIPRLSAKDRKGKIHYMGLYDYEGSYDKFITGGAKKYAVEKGGEFEITIAGVPKKAGSAYMGKIENFKEGFVFKGLKNAVKYPDVINTRKDVQHWQIDGHMLEVTSFAYIYPTDYTLELTDAYRLLVDSCRGKGEDEFTTADELEIMQKILNDYAVYNDTHGYEMEEISNE